MKTRYHPSYEENKPMKIKDFLAKKFIKEFKRAGYKVVTCPVCDNETFDNWFICYHCGWEYDYIRNLDDYSCANDCTLREYKEKRHLI